MHYPSGRRNPGISVIIVDATRIECESLAARLKKDHCSVTYAGTSAKDAFCELANAEVALISAALEGDPGKGYELASQIRRCSANVQVVVLVDHSDSHSVLQTFRSGAHGIFGRDGSLELISKCISRVHQGQVWASSEELQHLLEALSAPPRMRLVDSIGEELLAPREQEVVHWVAEGLTNRKIAEQLQLSANTVKNYLFRIFDKLGISNRVELILYATTQLGNRAKQLTDAAELALAATNNTVESQACRDSVDKLTVPQYLLGEMYRDGRNAQPNKTNALMWFLLAEHVCEESLVKSRQAREELERELAKGEVALGRRRAAEWMKKIKLSKKFSDN